ncbi:MAG: PHP domain-containing protein [Deltaproteobacteria bacterium]|nr:PHP domain-containing protein [Deltaproteobacteria bacterium]
MALIDLHTHSTASDGSLTPAAVVRLARERGLAAIALTDHDTIDGLPEAIRAGVEEGVEVVPGVEISARHPGGSMHILGLLVDYDDGLLDRRLAVLKQARRDRNPQIVAKLNSLGIPVSLDEVEAVSGGGQVGRPHIARALLERGAVRSIQEAFDLFLSNRGRAYVGKFRFPPPEAIAMIRESGGVPVLSHPFTLNVHSVRELRTLLVDLKRMGLAGLEVFYPEHGPDLEGLYRELAKELDLLITGGSDFHGDNKPEVELGRIACQGKITHELLDALKEWKMRRDPA